MRDPYCKVFLGGSMALWLSVYLYQYALNANLNNLKNVMLEDVILVMCE